MEEESVGCKTCKHCKALFLYLQRRYLRCKEDFCAQRKWFIDDYSGCEMWQKRKSLSELCAQGYELKLEDLNIKVIYLDD